MKKKLPPDPEEQNNERAAAAFRTLESFANDYGESWYGKSKKLQSELYAQNLSDLLCDFGHLCDRKGISLAVRLSAAQFHYIEETGHKGKQFADAMPPLPSVKAANALAAAIAKWRKAADGDSDDAEHDAGFELAEEAQSFLVAIATGRGE
jgi:hypothetical protein